MHQVGPPPKQITHRPQLNIVNMCLGQNVQPLQLRQVKRVVLVVCMFDAVVLLDLRGVGQIDFVTLSLQTIH